MTSTEFRKALLDSTAGPVSTWVDRIGAWVQTNFPAVDLTVINWVGCPMAVASRVFTELGKYDGVLAAAAAKLRE